MRTILHNDYRRMISARPGKGRFLIAEDEHMLTIFLHLPSISAAPESEVSRQQTLMQVAKVVRKKTAKQDVLIQGDWNVDWLPAHQCDPCAEEGRPEKHAEERLRLMAWAESLGLQITLPAACLAPHPLHEQTILAPVPNLML